MSPAILQPIEKPTIWFDLQNKDCSKNTESAYSFREYMSSKHLNIKYYAEHEDIGSLSFFMSKPVIETESQNLKVFSPIVRVTFQRTKKEDFHTNYFIGVSAYVVILRHFIWKLIIWRLSSGKTIILRILLILAISQYLITSIHIK